MKSFKWWTRAFSLLGALILIGLLIDLSRYVGVCTFYASQAELGLKQLRSIPNPKEAIVALTGDHSRIPGAIDLLRNRQSAVLIISGAGKQTSLRDLINVQSDAMSIHEIWEKIIVESQSTSTWENAKNTKALLEGRPWNAILLVTSDYHLPRAMHIFNRELPGWTITPYAIPSEFTTLSWSAPGNWFLGTFRVVSEYVKSWVFAYYLLWV